MELTPLGCAPVKATRWLAGRLTLAGICAAALLGQGLPAAGELDIKGDAQRTGAYVRLTRAAANQAGAVWLKSKQAVRGGFDTSFTFRFTDQGGMHGADGLAFLIQNSAPGAVGGIGGSGGFGMANGRPGIPYSLAIFFDTFRNREYGDPSDNSLQVCLNGTADRRKWPPAQLSIVPKLRVKLKDGREHRARVVYTPPVLAVYLDGKVLTQTPIDLSLVSDSAGTAWVGFTASTGAGYENHDLLSWDWMSSAESSISMVESSISFVLKACLPGKNLCTPEEAVVEERGDGTFHVVLPAHLPWGASVPNASGRGVEIVEARGMVCWDATRGSAGCGGPEGLLLNRTGNGRTQFSIRDESQSFEDNQGYFEFDVRFK